MNVLQNLTVFYNQLALNSTYRNVCKGILEHLEEAATGTIYDLAELTNSSRTTIWRMIQKLGYESFADFHHELRRAVKNYTYYNRILPAKDCTTSENVKSSLLQQLGDSYESLKNRLDVEAVERVAKQLHDAKKVRFYAPFQSTSIYSLQQNLAISGVETAYFCLFPEMLEDSRYLTPDSIVFINTIEHVETMDLSPVFKNMKEQGATIFGITIKNSKYKEYIAQELLVSGEGKIVEELIAFDIYFYMLSEIYRMKYIKD